MKKNKLTIAIDIDETIVKMKESWKDWCVDNIGYSPDFTREITNTKFLEYWKQPNLYDDKMPESDAIKTIESLSKYYDIVFVSHCFSEHIESKKRFLKKYFSKIHYTFIDTEHKHNIPCDYIIDDRERFLTKMDSDVITILIKTEFKSTGIADFEMSWIEIKDLLIN